MALTRFGIVVCLFAHETSTAHSHEDPAEPLVVLTSSTARIRFDLRYATPNNFSGKQLYAVAVCALRKSVAEKMLAAQQWLDEHHPGLHLLFKDCYRPNRSQQILWDAVKGTPKSAYVKNPAGPTGSMHSYGAAVDVTLADSSGREVDMGTPYDFLGRLAEPRYEVRFLNEGKLSESVVRHRRILRSAMQTAKMRGIRNEWWHFESGTTEEILRKWTRLDVPLDEIR